MPAPAQFKRSWWEGTGVSILMHVLILGALIYAATHAKQVVNQVNQVTEKLDYIFLDKPKPGPGGGGGGTPKGSRASAQGRDRRGKAGRTPSRFRSPSTSRRLM